MYIREELIFLPKAWDYLEKFKNDCLKFKSENTISGYIFDLKLFKVYLKDDFENLNREKIEDYKKYLQDKGSLATTINRKLVSIRRFIEFLEKTELNLKFEIEIESVNLQKNKRLKNLLTYDEFKRLVKAASNANDKRAVAIFTCLYLTGLRVSEMLTLKVSDLAKENLDIWGKGNKQRNIPLTELLKVYLTDYIIERQHKYSSKLFINVYADTPMTRFQVHKIIKKYASKIKIKGSKAHAHNFRHLCALQMQSNGTPLGTIGELLGHEDINYTKIYTEETRDVRDTHMVKLAKGGCL